MVCMSGSNRCLLYSVLLAWVLTNALLGAAITSTNEKATDAGANKAVSGYMTFLLYSVAGLACELCFPCTHGWS